MNPWTSAKDLRNRLHKEWDKGRLLSAQLTGETLFPLRLPLKQPSPSEIGDQYGRVKEWIDELIFHARSEKGYGYDLEWREVNHRQLGRNRLPLAAVFEQAEDALRFIGKQREAEAFRLICTEILGAFPSLKQWLAKRSLIALANAEQWPRLLAVLEWLHAHPKPGIYIRQMEIPQVDTKFIEHHKKLLGELLDIVLPPTSMDENARGISAFEQRYGFLAKPVQIRFRLLDLNFYIQGLPDLQIPAEAFARLDLNGLERIFITENDINGLAFPCIKKSLVIFGLGYGLERLADANWISSKYIYYWGDIDTHGFAMLDQIRHYFPQTRSFLMDKGTLMAHRPLWGNEPSPVNRNLMRLNPTESELYEDLVKDRLTKALRLEQERISFSHLKIMLKQIENMTKDN